MTKIQLTKASDGRDYQVCDGTFYHEHTPLEVIALLESLRTDRRIVRVHYGRTNEAEPEPGLDWLEECDVEGRVDRSCGEIKIPLLVPVGDTGGPGILTHCLVRVCARNGKDLYRHKHYHAPRLFAARDGDVEGEAYLIRRADGDVHARFSNLRALGAWVRRMDVPVEGASVLLGAISNRRRYRGG